MSQLIFFNNVVNGVNRFHFCVPSGEIHINDVLGKDIPSTATEVKIVERAQLPIEDFDLGDAFVWDGEQVVVDLGKAKEVTKNRLRVEREPLLAAQDVLFQRALETGADTKAIVAEKQRLRDITKLADSATTKDELRTINAGA